MTSAEGITLNPKSLYNYRCCVSFFLSSLFAYVFAKTMRANPGQGVLNVLPVLHAWRLVVTQC